MPQDTWHCFDNQRQRASNKPLQSPSATARTKRSCLLQTWQWLERWTASGGLWVAWSSAHSFLCVQCGRCTCHPGAQQKIRGREQKKRRQNTLLRQKFALVKSCFSHLLLSIRFYAGIAKLRHFLQWPSARTGARSSSGGMYCNALTFDAERAMSNSVLMTTQVTTSSCPYKTCTGWADMLPLCWLTCEVKMIATQGALASST